MVQFKQVYGSSDIDMDKVVKHTAETRESKSSQGARHPLKDMKDRPGTAPAPDQRQKKGKGGRKRLNPSMNPDQPLADGDIYGAVTTNTKGYAKVMSTSKSTTSLPPVSGASSTNVEGDGKSILKQLDLRVDPSEKDDSSSTLGKSGGKDMRQSKRETDGPRRWA